MGCLEKIASRWWGMLILSSIPFFIILAPVLFAGRIFLDSDLTNWVYPIYQFYQQSLAQGESIFWNPNNFSGFPSFIGSMGFLSPLHFVLFRLLPLFTAYNLIIFLNVTLALFFTWRFLRKFNLPMCAGFIGGLVYVFSQWPWVHNITIVNALPVLPLLFLILWRIKEKTDSWSMLFGGLLIGYGFLSVHLNWLAMILSAGFLFSLFLGWFDSKKWLVPLKFFLMVLMGIVIGSFIIWPLLNYNDLSARSNGLSYQETTGGALMFGDFLRYFLPYFKTSIFDLAASSSQLYLGILPLFFLVLAFGFRTSLITFFSFLFFLCLLISVKYSPLFWILHELPVFNSFRGPSRWMFVGSFAAAVLTGFGIKYFLIEEKNRWKTLLLKILKWIGWFFLSVSVVSSLVFYFFRDRFISLAQSYFDKTFYSQTSGLSIEYYHEVIKGMLTEIEQLFNILSPKVFLPIIFILASYFILRYFYKNKSSVNYFFPTISMFILLNFFSVSALDYSVISSKDFYRQPTTVEYLKKDINQLQPEESRRVLSFLPGFSEYNKLTVPYRPKGIEPFIFQSEMLTPNLNLFYGLESIDVYDNLMSRRMSRILALIGSDRATIGEKLANLKITPQEKAKKLEERKKLLNLLGIRYIISVFPLNEKIFPQLLITRIPPYDIPLNIYENPEARPLLYFANRVRTVEPDEYLAYQRLLKESLGERDIFIECSDCSEQLGIGHKGKVVLEARTNSFIQLTAESITSNWLVFSENHLPGWRAWIDNQEVDIYTVNSVYMAVFVPIGQHQVVFKYNPYNL